MLTIAENGKKSRYMLYVCYSPSEHPSHSFGLCGQAPAAHALRKNGQKRSSSCYTNRDSNCCASSAVHRDKLRQQGRQV